MSRGCKSGQCRFSALGSDESKEFVPPTFLDHVIVGGETGPRARPMHPDWVRGIRDQCQAVGVPFFFKSWGEWLPQIVASLDHKTIRLDDQWYAVRFGKKIAGYLLDGREWRELPETVAAAAGGEHE
jgi:protein gp37